MYISGGLYSRDVNGTTFRHETETLDFQSESKDKTFPLF